MTATQSSEPMPRIGVSIISLLWVIPPFLPRYGERLNGFCRKNDLCLQLVPLWCMSEKDIRDIDPQYVVSYESGWNSQESISEIISRIFNICSPHWDPAAALGPLLFGFRAQQHKRMRLFSTCFRTAFAVDVPDERSAQLIETSINNWMDIEKRAKHDKNICVDLWHLRKDDASKIAALRALIRISVLLGYEPCPIQLIHFQSRNTLELTAFIQNNYLTFLEEALREIYSHKTDCSESLATIHELPIIMELFPSTLTNILKVAQAIKRVIRESILVSLTSQKP